MYVIPPSTNLSLKETIDYLNRNTDLDFTFLSNNFIAINEKEFSQIVCGYILDSETNLGLQDVTIQGKRFQTITDANGYFRLEVNSLKEYITIRYLGFKTVQKPVTEFKEKECLTLNLIPEVESLSEIVITNFLIKGIDKSIDGILKVDFKDFEILPGVIETDVLQTIQELPGVQSVNETISDNVYKKQLFWCLNER